MDSGIFCWSLLLWLLERLLVPGPTFGLKFQRALEKRTILFRLKHLRLCTEKIVGYGYFRPVPCGMVCAYIMFDLPLNAPECKKSAN